MNIAQQLERLPEAAIVEFARQCADRVHRRFRHDRQECVDAVNAAMDYARKGVKDRKGRVWAKPQAAVKAANECDDEKAKKAALVVAEAAFAVDNMTNREACIFNAAAAYRGAIEVDPGAKEPLLKDLQKLLSAAPSKASSKPSDLSA